MPYVRTVKTALGATAAQIVYSSRQARPVYHHLRESIEAHLTIVFAAPQAAH